MDVKKIVFLIIGVVLVRGVYNYWKNPSKMNSSHFKSEVIKTGLEEEKFTLPSKNKAASEQKESFYKAELQKLALKSFTNKAELTQSMTELVNKLALDSSVSYAEKTALRKEIDAIETQKEKDFPDREISGFQKSLIKPGDENSGYHIEPEFK